MKGADLHLHLVKEAFADAYRKDDPDRCYTFPNSPVPVPFILEEVLLIRYATVDYVSSHNCFGNCESLGILRAFFTSM